MPWGGGCSFVWPHCCRLARPERRCACRRRNRQVYPGATHSYDYPYPARRSATGHTMAYDARATEQSWVQIDTFLKQHVQ